MAEKSTATQTSFDEQDKNALTQLLGLTVAKATTQIAGGTSTDGNASGVNAKLATEFNYLKHQDRKDLKKAKNDCYTTGNAQSCQTATTLEKKDATTNVVLEQSIASCEGEACNTIARLIKDEMAALGCTAPNICTDNQTLQAYWQAAQGKAQGLEQVYVEEWLLNAKAAYDVSKLALNAVKALGAGASKEAIAQTIAKVTADAGKKNNFYRDGTQIEYGASRVVTNPDEAIFWSGRTNGVGGADIAQLIASTKYNGMTLEAIMSRRGIQMPAWDATNPQVVKAWQDISAEYANQVSGTVRAVVGKNLRPGNVWETAELPALMKNPRVDKIITVDPVTGMEKNFQKRKPMILDISRGHIKVQIGERIVTISGEMFFPGNGKMGFVLFTDAIRHWDTPHQNQVVTESEIKEIIIEIQDDFSKGGHLLEIE